MFVPSHICNQFVGDEHHHLSKRMEMGTQLKIEMGDDLIIRDLVISRLTKKRDLKF